MVANEQPGSGGRVVWGSLHISSCLPEAVGESSCTQGPVAAGGRGLTFGMGGACWPQHKPTGWPRAPLSSWPAKVGNGLNPGCSGEARASYTADYPRRGQPSPLLALPAGEEHAFFDIAGGPAEASARPEF